MALYYIAYGSNLNLKQMEKRCPTAKVIATTTLKDFQLLFCGYATIIEKRGKSVQVSVWSIEKDDELNLDVYERFPDLYRKENVKININGDILVAMVYIINEVVARLPTTDYLDIIKEGYQDMNLDCHYLDDAIAFTKEIIKLDKLNQTR